MAERPDFPEVPEALTVPKRRWGFQWVWLLPVVAAVIGGWLLWASAVPFGEAPDEPGALRNVQ